GEQAQQGLVDRLHHGSFGRSAMGGERRLYVLDRYRCLGVEQDSRLGMGYYRLRLVGRYRPCRDTHICSIVVVPAELAKLDQPVSRGDDNLCGNLRGYLCCGAHGTTLVSVLDFPLAQSVRIVVGEL